MLDVPFGYVVPTESNVKLPLPANVPASVTTVLETKPAVPTCDALYAVT